MLDVTVARLDVDRVLRMGELAASAEDRDRRPPRRDRPDLAPGARRLARRPLVPLGPHVRPAAAARVADARRAAAARALRRDRPRPPHARAVPLGRVRRVRRRALRCRRVSRTSPRRTRCCCAAGRAACLPTSLTPGTAYGPRTPEVEDVLRHAWAASPAARLRAHEARAAIPAHVWNAACGVVDETSTRVRRALPRPVPVRRGAVRQRRPRAWPTPSGERPSRPPSATTCPSPPTTCCRVPSAPLADRTLTGSADSVSPHDPLPRWRRAAAGCARWRPLASNPCPVCSSCTGVQGSTTTPASRPRACPPSATPCWRATCSAKVSPGTASARWRRSPG